VQKKDDEAVFRLKPATYAALPGWQTDNQSEALAALKQSCTRIMKKDAAETFGAAGVAGNYADWQTPCANLPATGGGRAFFETYFTPYEVWGDDRDGLFTGYYVPSLPSSPQASVPIYGRPSDLVTVDLGAFKPEWKGETITGRLVGGEKLIPYPARAEIEKEPLKNAEVIARVNDSVDAFFLQIQGSGVVQNADGTVVPVGYAAQNGHAYTAVGKVLLDRGHLKKEDVSMQSIRRWLAENPKEAQAIMNENKSFVFFRRLDSDGVPGAEGVALTPMRSIAVDRRKIPYGAPVYIDTESPDGKGGRLQRLMVAQDTGGAIRGAVRGDFFWGAGDRAAEMAGVMKSRGQAYVLLPKTVSVPKQFLK
jgi:membrane-bound lytic murein transglycosylase A